MGKFREWQDNVVSWFNDNLLSIAFIFLFLFAISLFFIPHFITQALKYSFEDTGQVGDTVGGTTAPFIGFFAALATFAAFWVQYKANQNQLKAFKDQADANKHAEEAYENQRRILKLERFENQFYEMLRLHKENVREIELGGKHKGRKAFVWMYREFHFLYHLTQSELEKINDDSDVPVNSTLSEITELAYIIFFFGAGEISKLGIDAYTDSKFNRSLILNILTSVNAYQEDFKLQNQNEANNGWAHFILSHRRGTIVYEFNYFPFDGHVAKLGHYFRHLYQTIKLATTHRIFEKSISEHEERYEYVKTLRVQLSNHEQAMIYYNSFFTAGKVWWGDETIDVKNKDAEHLSYFLDYGMIKNLPFNLTNGMGPDPVHEFLSRLLKRGYSDETEKNKAVLIERMKELFEWNINAKVKSFYNTKK